MPIRATRKVLTRVGASRAGRCIGLAAVALLLGNKGLQNAVAEGDTRTISLHHMHTGEDLTITYKRDGRYDEAALKQLNHLLRDWRKDEEIKMDPRLIDVVWEVYREVDAKGPIQVVCGYRSPATNEMLRRRSRGVARYSQHMLGRAMDFFIPGVSLETQREAGVRLQRGGVGYYPSSGSPFIHLDVGSVRMWPRMSREQLARVFPNGRTVHVPTDGHPLSGYAQAQAELEKRRSSEPSQASLEVAGANTQAQPRRNLFAALFTSKDEEEDSQTAAESKAVTDKAPQAQAASAAAKSMPAPKARPVRTAAKATTKSAPGASFNLASAESQPVGLKGPAPRAEDDGARASANDVIANRGFWQAPATETAPAKDRVQVAAAAARPTPQRAAPEQHAAAETTGALAAPWPMKGPEIADRVPPEVALAYAPQATNKAAPTMPVTRGLTVGSTASRTATTIQEAANLAAPTAARAPVAAAPALKAGALLEDPWLRALVLAPDLQSFMTATLLGPPDMRGLVALMEKPDSVITMTFGEEPNPGLATDHFSGSAVVFIATTTFEKRTAALQ